MTDPLRSALEKLAEAAKAMDLSINVAGWPLEHSPTHRTLKVCIGEARAALLSECDGGGERDPLSIKGIVCGQVVFKNNAEGARLYGCGDAFAGIHDFIVCLDCGMAMHPNCLRDHFAKSTPSRDPAVDDRIREALDAGRRERVIAMEKTMPQPSPSPAPREVGQEDPRATISRYFDHYPFMQPNGQPWPSPSPATDPEVEERMAASKAWRQWLEAKRFAAADEARALLSAAPGEESKGVGHG